MGKRADLRRKHNDTTMSVVRRKRGNVTVIVRTRRRAGGENPMNRKRGNRMGVMSIEGPGARSRSSDQSRCVVLRYVCVR